MVFDLLTINFIYALVGLVVLVGTVILFYDYYCQASRLYKRYVRTFTWPLIMLTTLGGVATTLLYSEYFGIVPCSLCWLQRIALYPQALLSIIAFRAKDTVFFPLYGIALSVFGLLVAIYQYIYQLVPKEVIQAGIMPCLADGSADCGDKVMEVFGFVTFPFLSAVLFAFLIVLYLNLRRDRDE